MRKLLLLICLPLISYAQKLPVISIGTVRIVENDHTTVAELGEYQDQVKPQSSKTYYWYSGNRIQHTQGGFSGRLLNGTYSEYYLNKNLKQQGTYKNGLKDGKWKTWESNGLLIEEVTWKKGIKEGTYAYYDKKGRISESGKYHHDLMEGSILHYQGPDTVQQVNYKKGLINNDTAKSKKWLKWLHLKGKAQSPKKQP